MSHKCEKIAIGVVSLLLLIPSSASAQVFSIDDNTALPATWVFPAALPGAPFGAGYGVGAEDPFGVLIGLPGLAPSPSLVTSGVFDGDILTSGGGFGPFINTSAPFDAFFGTGITHAAIDALSNNSVPNMPVGASYNLLFSVDRLSSGLAGSASRTEAGFNQQPGDIYVSTMSFPDPALFVGLPPFSGYVGPLLAPGVGSNALLIDESKFDLQVGLGPGPAGLLPPGVFAPPITGPPAAGGTGSHDNLDAFELRFIDTTGDLVEDIDYFFSIYADQALSDQFASGGIPFDSADVWFTPAGAGGASFLYAKAGALGLTPFPPFPQPLPMQFAGNDLDALVVWDRNMDGIASPGIDFALFSLAPGSVDLAINGLTPDDILFTDFSGSFGLFASAGDIGLLGFNGIDNVDALEVVLTGDANLDGKVDFLDFSAVSGSFGFPGGGWMGGDFNGDGITNFLDFSALSANWTAMTGAIQTVPEPSSMAIFLIGLLGCCATGRRCKAS